MKSLSGMSALAAQSSPCFVVAFVFSLTLFAINPLPLHGQTVGGAVIGLAGSGLVLTESYNANGTPGTQTVTLNSNTPGLPNFTFPDGVLPKGTTYNVTISTLPSNPGQSCSTSNTCPWQTTCNTGPTCPGQQCTITGGSGTVGTGIPANSSVFVYCYYLSGTVSGLPTGQSVTIQNNLGTPFQTSSDGSFTFPAAVVTGAINPDASSTAGVYGANYSVTVSGSPYSWGTCSVAKGTGTADGGTAQSPPLNPNKYIGGVWVTCHANNAPPLPPSQWKPLTNLARDSSGNLFYPGTMLLLPDGSVLMNGPANSPQEWLRLIPDNTGHYVNGTWTSVPNSICPHGFYASQMMSNGKLFIAGGEYPGPTPGCTGLVDTEIYDPSVPPGGMPWTGANPPKSLIDPTATADNLPGGGTAWCPSGTTQGFLDMISETLPNGSVLMAPVCPMNCGDTLVYNPSTGWLPNAIRLMNTGGSIPTGYSCSQQEDTWVKLQDGSILTADPPSPPAQAGCCQTPQTSERFVPTANPGPNQSPGQWVPEASLGFALYDTEFGWSGGGETGPAFTLPDGQAVFIGGSPVMGTYDPVANAWSQSNIKPNGPATGGVQLGGFDSPGAMMINGKILLALGFAATVYNSEPSPAFFYEYDPSAGTYTEVLGPGNSGAPSAWSDCGSGVMLDLPDGTVLAQSSCNGYNGANPQLYVYTPTGTPLPNGQPLVQIIAPAGGNCSTCYLVTGNGFNGISEGASFGDDAQMATDFPIVQLTDGSGNVAYARTYNWSSTSILPGTPGSTYFQVPTGFGACELQVVGNGNPSAVVSFTHDCVVRPHVVAICGLPCIFGSTVVWARPNSFGDPWVDGVAVSLVTSDPEATELLGDYELSVDTQTVLKSEDARQVAIAPSISGSGSALVVGPTIKMRSRKAGDQRNRINAHVLAGMISIPYERRGLAREGKVRIVQFDDRRARWVSVPGSQKVDESKHIVTAAISGVGKFTVIAEVRRAHPRN